MHKSLNHLLSKRISKGFLLLGIGIVALSSCEKDDDNNTTPTPSGVDAAFLPKASISNLAEIDMGQTAQSKGQDTSVQNFGKLMIAEHTLAQTDLVPLAASKSVTIPTAVDARNKAIKDRISTYSGAQFDTAYIHTQIMAHTQTLADFKNAAAQSADQDVKNYANKYIPHIQMHLDRANAIASKLPLK